MTTAFSLRQLYLDEIDKIAKDPEEFAYKVLHVATVIRDHMEGHPTLRNEVISGLSSIMLNKFLKIPAKDLGPMEVVKMLEDVYGENGPFKGQPVSFFIVKANSPSWIAALQYLQSVGEKSVENIGKSKLTNIIAWAAFEGGRDWKGLQKALAEVDASCGTRFLESVPELLENAHTLFLGHDSAMMIQMHGGIERVKAVGANLDLLTRAVMDGLPKTDLNEKGFPLMYAFIKDATLELMAAGAVSREEGEGRFSCLFEATLHALTRQKNHKHDCWIPILKDLSKYAGAEVNQLGLVNLGMYLDKKGVDLEGFSLHSMIRPDEFKKAMKKAVYEGDQHTFIEKLALTEHFSHHEMMKIKGRRLQSDLGM